MSAYPFGRAPKPTKPKPPHRDPARVKLSQVRAAMGLLAAIFKPAQSGR